jgi:hypothetical protein
MLVRSWSGLTHTIAGARLPCTGIVARSALVVDGLLT